MIKNKILQAEINFDEIINSEQSKKLRKSIYDKEYLKRNNVKEKRNKSSKEFYKKNKDKCLEYAKLYNLKNPKKAALTTYKSNLKYYYGITLEQYNEILISL